MCINLNEIMKAFVEHASHAFQGHTLTKLPFVIFPPENCFFVVCSAGLYECSNNSVAALVASDEYDGVEAESFGLRYWYLSDINFSSLVLSSHFLSDLLQLHSVPGCSNALMRLNR